MSFTSSNPVSIGEATKKSHYDNVFDNTKYNKDRINGDDAEGSGVAGHFHEGGANGVALRWFYSMENTGTTIDGSSLANLETRNYSDLQSIPTEFNPTAASQALKANIASPTIDNPTFTNLVLDNAGSVTGQALRTYSVTVNVTGSNISGTSAPESQFIGAKILGFYPVSGFSNYPDTETIIGVTLNGDGSVTVTLSKTSSTAVIKVILAYN